jgi:C-terminal processing protease CtpA/Prc
LEDDTDVYKYCIPTNASIFLNPEQRKVKIRARQKGSKKPVEFTLTVDDSYTIDQVKKMIKDQTNLPILFD